MQISMNYGHIVWLVFHDKRMTDYYSIASKPALGLTQAPIVLVPGALFSGIKQLNNETDHWPPFPGKFSWCDSQLIKSRDKFTFINKLKNVHELLELNIILLILLSS
jgi:hypothetical protein